MHLRISVKREYTKDIVRKDWAHQRCMNCIHALSVFWIRITLMRRDADPDSIYHPDADSDPTFHPDADPDPDPNFKKKAQTLEKVLK
jgi:hypothetical protein